MGNYDKYLPYIDVTTGMQRIRNNAKLYTSLLNSFTKGNYDEAIKNDFNTMNLESLKVDVHTIKGAGANLSFDALAEACKNYEFIIKDNAVNQTNFDELIAVYDKTMELLEQLKAELTNPA